jgi:hypothetical protein
MVLGSLGQYLTYCFNTEINTIDKISYALVTVPDSIDTYAREKLFSYFTLRFLFLERRTLCKH